MTPPLYVAFCLKKSVKWFRQLSISPVDWRGIPYSSSRLHVGSIRPMTRILFPVVCALVLPFQHPTFQPCVCDTQRFAAFEQCRSCSLGFQHSRSQGPTCSGQSHLC